MSPISAVPDPPPLSLHRSSRIVRWIIVPCFCGFVACLLSGLVVAQDLHVVTKVSHQHPRNGNWQPLSRSLTLFHAGKVYDRVEAVGEVVIFEPSKSQFVILSLNGNKMAANVRFEEILQLLKMARIETVKYMDELHSLPMPSRRRAIEALAFQLEPQFDETFDTSTGTLKYSSEFVNYEVETAAVEQPRVVEKYLEWADWTARLNFVLHPQAVMPESRIALNKVLRERDRIPTQVNLKLSIDGETRLRAEHSFVWKLRSFDRDFIAKWEKELISDDVRWVDLREYQRILITSSSRRGR